MGGGEGGGGGGDKGRVGVGGDRARRKKRRFFRSSESRLLRGFTWCILRNMPVETGPGIRTRRSEPKSGMHPLSTTHQ